MASQLNSVYDEEPISSFVFGSRGNQQTFRHQWQVDGELQECDTCFSSIDADEPPSQHWLQHGRQQQPQLSKQQQAVLDIIEARRIETFFICDESAKDDLDSFMSDTCSRAVPELLRWMFHNGSQRVEFNLACYVNVLSQVHIFQSGSLCVEHHYDIEECVSVIYEMITQRIENYLASSHDVGLEECSITRLRVQVKRMRNDNESACDLELPLPLQLRHESATVSHNSKTSEAELASLHAAYVKHHRECNGYFPSNMRVNLYGLQQCQTTKELYVVPYHISETLQQQPNKNFLILNNSMGQFQRLHELQTPIEQVSNSSESQKNQKHNNNSRSRPLQCRRCRAQFKCRSRLHIHQQLRCGQDFSVDSMHPDIVEIYEQCLPISRSHFQFNCYGITKPKTVMRKGQFVPIECDWRKKSSVQVQHGPCVIISNSEMGSPCKLS
ncbi:protein terminus-like [Drosophila sulfurigaster albostrigata]|uniref:protein terminus-like n=1 Tax=Drosophila sulfurigaster albostrigata TaxID=89887 RepID=UPI002D21B0D0|nr:protein terminus-like [Drosophila sulfurigaster albostrigata]